RAARGGERAARARPAAQPAAAHEGPRGGRPVPAGPLPVAARRGLLRRGRDRRRHRARGDRRRVRARRGRGRDRGLPAGGLALGLFPGLSWETEELDLPAGASLVLFTDGLFEGRTGPGSERLGEDGLLDIARRLAALPSADFVDTMIDQAEQTARDYGGLDDDVAV